MTEQLNRFKSAWHDPVWSKVIAQIISWGGGALAALAAIIWHRFLIQLVQNAWRYLTAHLAKTISIPLWVFIPWILVSAFMAVRFLASIRQFDKQLRLNNSPISAPVAFGPPDWLFYTEDVFDDIRWKWKYEHDGRIDIHYIKPFCLACGCELTLHQRSRFAPTLGRCEHCDEYVVEVPGREPREELERVKKLIQRKLSTGEYKDAIKQVKAPEAH